MIFAERKPRRGEWLLEYKGENGEWKKESVHANKEWAERWLAHANKESIIPTERRIREHKG